MKEINLENANAPIPAGFKISDLKGMNIIVGKNNAGKTRFFEAVEKQFEENDAVTVLYVRAREVKIEEELKGTADNSNLVRNIIELFKVSNLDFEIKKEAQDMCTDILNHTNANFKSITGDDVKFNTQIGTHISLKWAARSVMNMEKVTLDALKREGQGYQKLIIASFLRACVDKIKESCPNQEILILFEEPEVYLHPSLKKELNRVLRDIASAEKYQVIVSTHDPYFLWSNINQDDTSAYAFRNEEGNTVLEQNVVFGVEDEMLFITLYNKVIKSHRSIDALDTHLQSKYSDDVMCYKKCEKGCGISKCRVPGQNISLVTYIRHQIHHANNKCNKKYDDEQFKKSVGILAKEI